MKKITQEEFQVLLASSIKMTKDHPYLRIGQAMFNILYDKNPILADSLRGTDKDPFHARSLSDLRVEKFKNYIII